MNYDKKLAKYAKNLNNPKYYIPILRILEDAENKNYKFKLFTEKDIEHIYDEIDCYMVAVPTEEDHKRMVKYCNSIWFIISDKKYILWETQSLFIALGFMLRGYMMMFFVKLSQLINPYKAFDTHNIDWDMYLIHGGLEAAEFLGCEIFDLDEYRFKEL